MKVDVNISDLKMRMLNALKLRGITGDSAEFMVNDFIEAELGEHSSHGLSKFLLIDAALSKREGPFELVKEIGNYAQVNGHRDLGHMAGLYCVNKAVDLAKKHGNSIVALQNASRYSRLKPFAKRIAECGYIAIIMNNGGPSAVAPYGGTTPIFGTNPICFAFPSECDDPYLFDFSTSKKVWAEIRQAILEKRSLSANCFYDRNGHFTEDPEQANAVMSFGGAKGYALCFAIEILTGAFIGCKMGKAVSDEYDLGFLFIALSPEMFGTLETFKRQVDELANEVRNSSCVENVNSVYIPGDKSKHHLQIGLMSGQISVEEDILNRIYNMEISLSGGLESNSKLN